MVNKCSSEVRQNAIFMTLYTAYLDLLYLLHILDQSALSGINEHLTYVFIESKATKYTATTY